VYTVCKKHATLSVIVKNARHCCSVRSSNLAIQHRASATLLNRCTTVGNTALENACNYHLYTVNHKNVAVYF